MIAIFRFLEKISILSQRNNDFHGLFFFIGKICFGLFCYFLVQKEISDIGYIKKYNEVTLFGNSILVSHNTGSARTSSCTVSIIHTNTVYYSSCIGLERFYHVNQEYYVDNSKIIYLEFVDSKKSIRKEILVKEIADLNGANIYFSNKKIKSYILRQNSLYFIYKILEIYFLLCIFLEIVRLINQLINERY